MSTTENSIRKRPVSRTAAEAILEQLDLYGVKRIYGVIGDAIFGLMDAIAKQTKIQFIAVKHESVAAMMASAEAKCTGALGVCAAQMGPGLANLINGLGDAYLDGVPVLAITGQAPLKKIGTSYKQYINQQELVQAITKYSQIVVHPDAVIDSLTKAIHTSLTMDTVSQLSIPADVFTMQTIVPSNEPITLTEMIPSMERLQQAQQFMRSAKCPMILVGNSVRPMDSKIQLLAERWGSGIVTGYGAIGIIPDHNPFNLGGLGEGGNPLLTNLFRQADVVLSIGASWWPEGHTPTNARIITVQDKQMELGNGMPMDCGIVGNIAEIISQLISGLESHDMNQNWIGQIRLCKQTWSIQNEREGNESGYPLHPSSIVRAIERCTSPNTIITLDEGDSTLWFMRNFRAQCEYVLLSSHWRTMGFGLPAALTAKLCMPNKHVVCITGDGGLAMVLADLLTAVRYQLQITVIVLNNGTLQMEQNKMVLKGLIPEGTELTNPDYIKLAEACGWDAYKIQSKDELEKRLKTRQVSQKPVLLDVPTAQVEYPNYQNS
ncbi:thiamine pyrophosphate-binding protein [Bacillus sp. EB600]|uniref:thiamine pyrophosphate-binding protein n=1 Tax=Bacillus sp. EB600 TaxID=2806345 RepID=UPI002109D846|nr:thiamine pyrophosphate-binding protein [Bacillus sp. EB600]